MITYDSETETLRFYTNGILDSTHSNIPPPNATTTADMFIGRDSASSNYSFHGAIDDIYIYGRTLSSQEVQSLYESTPVDVGLIAYYPFNGNADDESGNGHTGTVYGATLTTDRFGNAGSAYSFDGVNNYIDIGNCLGTMQTPFTVSIWVCTTNSRYQVPIGKKTGRSWIAGQWQFDLGAESDLVGFRFCEVSGALQSATVTTNIYDGIWHQLCGVMDSDGGKLYYDGKLVGINTNMSLTFQHNSRILIGARDGGVGGVQFVDGKLDDVRIYDRAISAAEVMKLHREGRDQVSWLMVDPKSGTVPPGDSMAIAVRFDAEGFVAGDYTNTTLTVECNDALSPSNGVPASMWVLPTAPTMMAEPEFTAGTSNEVAWSMIEGPVSYWVEIMADTNAAPLQQSGWIAATNHLFSGLETNSVYYYRAKASVPSTIGRLEGAWSGWVWSRQVGNVADIDGDSIPNWWELMYFGDLTSCDPLLDPDGDGQNNIEEFTVGMDPTNSASYFTIRSFDSPTNGAYVLTWDSVTGRIYSIWWTPDMMLDFQILETDIRFPQNSHTDTVHSAEAAGFYSIDVQLDD